LRLDASAGLACEEAWLRDRWPKALAAAPVLAVDDHGFAVADDQSTDDAGAAAAGCEENDDCVGVGCSGCENCVDEGDMASMRPKSGVAARNDGWLGAANGDGLRGVGVELAAGVDHENTGALGVAVLARG